MTVFSKSNGIVLLIVVSSDTSEGLQHLLLGKFDIFSDVSVAELVVCAIYVIAGGNDKIKSFFTRHAFHDLGVRVAVVVGEYADAHK